MPSPWIRRLLSRLGLASGTATTPAHDSPAVLDLFDVVHAELDRRGIEHALIGGLALSTVGVVRATDDVDLLVDGEREDEVHRALGALGFDALHRTENISSYVLGNRRVDFVHARRPYSRQMLADARRIEVRPRVFQAVRAEDLIGLKVQATSNDPTRTQDLEDIRRIIAANRSMDMDRVRQYFALFGRQEELDELLASFEAEDA